MAKRIPLTMGRSRIPSGLYALVDDIDYEAVGSLGWRVFVSRGHYYAMHGTEFLHRRLLEAPEHLLVNHRNGDGLDNRRQNIRLVTTTQTLASMTPHAIYGGHPTASAFKGVSLMKGRRDRPWRATIRVEGKQHFLGQYLTEEEAARAYDAAAVRFFGSFARTNFAVEGA